MHVLVNIEVAMHSSLAVVLAPVIVVVFGVVGGSTCVHSIVHTSTHACTLIVCACMHVYMYAEMHSGRC